MLQSVLAAGAVDLPVEAPRPDPNPVVEPKVPPPSAPLPPARPPEAKATIDPRSLAGPGRGMPAGERSCRAALADLGATFEPVPYEPQGAGCALPYPLRVTGLGNGIALEPPAVMNCATALATVRFMSNVVTPAALEAFGARPTAVAQASAYVCRPRAGSTRLSEHAFGNALDIAGFELADGRSVQVGSQASPEGQRFVAEIRTAACGPFRTVLGPGSDADHADHLHLDLAPRRGGGSICQ